MFARLATTYVCPAGCTCGDDDPGQLTYFCSGGNLREVPSAIDPQTFRLFLSSNAIAELPSKMMATGPTNVRGLQFSRNRITRIAVDAFQWFPLLDLLLLDGNLLTEINPGMLLHTPRLERFNINTNHIMMPPVFPFMPRLVQLFMDENLLGGNLTRAHLAGLSSTLQMVSAQHILPEGITTLPADLFADCANITFLELSDNYMTALDDRFFDGCVNTLVTIVLDVSRGFPSPHSPHEERRNPPLALRCSSTR